MTAARMLAWLAVAQGSRRLRRLAPVLVAVLLFSLGCSIRLPSLLQQQAQEHARYAALDQQQAASSAQLAELEHLQAAVADAERRLREAHWHLAAGESMSDLLDRLAASGRAQGLLIERLEVHEDQQQAGFRRVPLELQVVGRYAALRVWLDDWLSQTRILRSGDMRLEAADDQPGLLRLRLQVDAYHASAPMPAAGLLAQLPAVAASPAPALDPFAPKAMQMASSGLASVPLGQLEMVGSLSRGAAHEALLMAAGRLYRVRQGDRLGRDLGVVTQVDPRHVEVRERLFLAGLWHERTAFVSLARRLGKEAPDQDENSEEMGTGGVAAYPAGVGDAL